MIRVHISTSRSFLQRALSTVEHLNNAETAKSVLFHLLFTGQTRKLHYSQHLVRRRTNSCPIVWMSSNKNPQKIQVKDNNSVVHSAISPLKMNNDSESQRRLKVVLTLLPHSTRVSQGRLRSSFCRSSICTLSRKHLGLGRPFQIYKLWRPFWESLVWEVKNTVLVWTEA